MVLLDTGPLVSYLAAGLTHHAWVCDQWKRTPPPLLTCEPVLTEAAFLLKREGYDAVKHPHRSTLSLHGGKRNNPFGVIVPPVPQFR